MEIKKEITTAELRQRWKLKKEKVLALANNMQSLRLNLTKDLKSDDEKVFLTALVISLMDKTAERVGNDESANNGHYGITGLEKKHIKINGDKIHLKYVGKSGVEHEKEFTDSKLANALNRAKINSSNHNVFTTSNGFNINAAKVNRYLKDFNVRAKDIRGYSANKWVIEKLKSKDIPKEEKDRKKFFSEVLKSVSEKIGHGKTMLKNQYLVPELEKNYIEMGKIIDVSSKESYEKGGPVTTNGKKGGWLQGKRHYSEDGKSLGGIPAVVGSGEKPVELEGGEVIINREASKKHWKELSRINQSAGDGVPIGPPDEDDTDNYKEGGKVIEFNPNDLPNRRIYDFAKMVKSKYPKVWDLGGNVFGNEAFVNLERALKRGYWTDNEKWMYVKWRAYVARHKGDYQIAGVIAMLKWVDKVEKGWLYMKKLIEDEIKKRYSKDKMAKGGGVDEEVYIEFLNKEKGFKKDIKHFKSYEEAVKWARENFDRFDPDMIKYKMAKVGKLIKRADGSYSERGLWDNVRDNIGSGKEPTKEMLEQEEKIKKEMKRGGEIDDVFNIELESDRKKVIAQVMNNVPFRTFASKFRKHIDKNFTAIQQEGLYGKSGMTWEENASYIIGDGDYSVTEEQFKNFIKEFPNVKYKKGGELAKGIEAEQEHKGTLEKLYQRKITPSQAPKSIAQEHLKEDPNYYTKLNKAKLAKGGLAIVNWFKSKPKVSDEVLYNWARQRLDINLLNWAGFRNEQEYEEQMDQPFVLEDFIKDFRAELEDTYIRRKDAQMIEMGKRGGKMKDDWIVEEDNRYGFTAHGLTRTTNPSLMYHTFLDVAPTLEKSLDSAEKMFAIDPELGRVEIQGKKSRKLYYIVTLNDDGTFDIQSSKNTPLSSMQFSNVAITEGSIADNRNYIRAKLFGETEKYKEPEELFIGDIVLINKSNENGFKGYVKVTEKDGYIYKGVSITHADNPARQDYQVKNATQKFSIGNISDNPSIQDEENLKIYKTRIKNQYNGKETRLEN